MTQTDPAVVENVDNGLKKAEKFFSKNRKFFIYFAAIIILAVGGYFAYKYLIVAPKEVKAAQESFYAERYFEMDSLHLALNGDGEHLGFLDVIDNYGVTEVANNAHFYAGVAYLRLGDFENAISFLKKFKTSDALMYSYAKRALGDAYLEIGNSSAALNAYNEVIKRYDNEQITPAFLMRSALVHESLGNYKQALNDYETILHEYPSSAEAREIDKYIARSKSCLGK